MPKEEMCKDGKRGKEKLGKVDEIKLRAKKGRGQAKKKKRKRKRIYKERLLGLGVSRFGGDAKEEKKKIGRKMIEEPQKGEGEFG